jgi:hypothetical protein
MDEWGIWWISQELYGEMNEDDDKVCDCSSREGDWTDFKNQER